MSRGSSASAIESVIILIAVPLLLVFPAFASLAEGASPGDRPGDLVSALAAKPAATGTATPTATLGPAPSNDEIGAAILIESFPFTHSSDTFWASVASDDPSMGSDTGVN